MHIIYSIVINTYIFTVYISLLLSYTFSTILWKIVLNKTTPTVNDYNAIKKMVTGNFSDYTMDEFDIKNNDELTSYRTIIAISVSIGIISALNTCLMYGYIISQRRKQMVVYGIIGAARIRRFAISESEMLVFSVTTSLVGVVLLHYNH